ncbi:Crp/Fnr family transcriptional regulator [Nocardia zapadnayensis]|uniref:Crp/Fnr family transcriptional regulator n=1 Tax=Brevibacterium pityocampae TaxID=506594 RepID=A0ABP8J757_9MICO|nr:Crp/Fnr family transcriptional regulator [Nocardia zapadnayensis]MCK1802862.1 Crp/Fnr family transcriptional regulator [Brevibacterium sp. R8603A2]MCX0277772.1 Crp/Fnr family transcriptional regulator [Nocardia zapadnayensis]
MDIEVVRNASLFNGLDDESTSALVKIMKPRSLRRGTALFHEGDPGDELYIVSTGKLKIGRESPDGRENLLSVVGPGEIIGELTLFDPGARSTTATAVSQTELLSLKHEDLMTWLRERPQAAMNLLKSLAQRLRRTNDIVGDLVFSDVPGRVAKSLLDLAERFGKQAPDGTLVAHDLTQEELAQLVGASRETVNKALADFAARGWLRLEARAVVILDFDRLRNRAH